VICGVAEEVGEGKVGQSALHRAEDFAGAAQAQILVGDAEAVARFLEDTEAGARVFLFRIDEKDAVALVFATTDTAAELVELGEAETLGVVDQHHVRIRHINADLDHGGGHEHIDLSVAEFTHHRVFLVTAHAAVDEPDAEIGGCCT
jgi:hypothetical protein